MEDQNTTNKENEMLKKIVNKLKGKVTEPKNVNDVAKQIHNVYSFGREERKRRGLIGREWALKNLSSESMCNSLIDGIETTLENYKPRKKFDLYKVV